ncbi:hypothetical protein CBS470a_012414 [Colletotrichum nupharicola]|nr:hypothetical protein CBS470a_012414 [Colletotrichum nupharicola]
MTTSVEPKTTSLAELNRVFWEYALENADSFYEQNWLKVFAEQLTRFLRTQAPNLGLRPRDASDPVRLLDYACAHGGASWVCRSLLPPYPTLANTSTQTQALDPFADEILGIDVAPAIVERFNKNATRLGYDSSRAHAIAGDLMTDASLPGPAPFDVAIISMALHHLDDPPAMLVRLAAWLKPGGVLIAVEGIDVEEKPLDTAAQAKVVHGAHGHIHGHGHGHSHEGHMPEVLKTTNHQAFDEEVFRTWFGAAGCEGKFVYIVNDEVSHIPEKASGRAGGLNRKMVIAAAMKE